MGRAARSKGVRPNWRVEVSWKRLSRYGRRESAQIIARRGVRTLYCRYNRQLGGVACRVSQSSNALGGRRSAGPVFGIVKRGWIPAAAGMTVRMACTCRKYSGSKGVLALAAEWR